MDTSSPSNSTHHQITETAIINLADSHSEERSSQHEEHSLQDDTVSSRPSLPVGGEEKSSTIQDDDFEEWQKQQLQSRGDGVRSEYLGESHDDFLDWLETKTGTVPRFSMPSRPPPGSPEEEEDSPSKDTLGPLVPFNNKVTHRRASTGPGIILARDAKDRDTLHTHEIQIDKITGRRRSVLDTKLTDKVVEAGGIWEADDEADESEEDDDNESVRMSSFNSISARSSTLRLVFDDVDAVGQDGNLEDDDEGELKAIANTQHKDPNRDQNEEVTKPNNVVSSVFGFLSRRRSSV